MRVLSGIQPSGTLHLGNYFGSIKPNLEFVGKAESSFFFVADLHALTTIQDARELKRLRWDTVLDYLACGFNPDRAVLYFQSDIPFHAELSWILSTVTPMGLLERAVSYKEKVEKGIPASAGLFTYPVLMASDILLYESNLVPVGKDQKQHLEMTRDIAMKFNNVFGETLVVPDPLIRDEVAVVSGTDGQKMSKSYGNTIPIFGSDAEIKKAVMGIVTDSKGMNDPKDPKTCVVYQIHKLFLSEGEQKTLADEYRNGLAYGDAKKKLLQTCMDYFAPMRKRRLDFEKDIKNVQKTMAEGARKATLVASATMEKVRLATGLR